MYENTMSPNFTGSVAGVMGKQTSDAERGSGKFHVAFPQVGCILDLTEAGPARCRAREVFTN
jgi:hypothetical protein